MGEFEANGAGQDVTLKTSLFTPCSALLAVLVASSFLIGCGDQAPIAASTGGQPEPGRTAPLKIVATTGMVADLVRQVVGERGKVVSLMGAGSDPHLYKPTRNDVRKLLDADVVVYSGLLLEHRMEETIQQIGRSGKHVFAITDRLDRSRLRPIPGSAGQYDPHVWMDVSIWADCASDTAEALAAVDPGGADDYRRRAETYRESLLQLDAYVARIIQSIPERQRVLVTAHDAFHYFAARYGMEVRAVQGISTESEAGVQDVNALVDFLVARQIPAVFVETSVSEKPLQAVIEGCRSRGRTVSLAAMLYSDAMGRAETYEGSYLGMLDANATHIARHLGGTAPEQGWQGKLALR